MKTITLRVGNKLKAKVKNPANAGIPKGAVVTIVRFGENDDYSLDHTDFHGKAPIVSYENEEWLTNVPSLFKDYKKVK